MILISSIQLLIPLFLCSDQFQFSSALTGSALFQKQRLFKLSSASGNQIKNDGKKSNLGSKFLQKIVKRTGAASIKEARPIASKEISGVPAKKSKIIPTGPTSNGSVSISSSSRSVASVLSMDDAADGSGNLESLIVDDGFRSLLRDFRKANAPKKLIRTVADYSQSGKLDQNMTVHAFRTLQRMNRF